MFNRVFFNHTNHAYLNTSEHSRASSATRVCDLSSATLQHTAAFKANPKSFLEGHTVDARHVIRMGDGLTGDLLNNTIKQGHFALILDASTGNFILKHVNAATAADRDKVIHAHWIPFKNGNGTPGYVDIPKDPRYATAQESAPFAFTPGMNGCSLEIREHLRDDRYMRVFHNQHPESATTNNLVREISGLKIGSFGPDDYHDENSIAPVAFNMMYFDRDSTNWKFLGQSLETNPYDSKQVLSRVNPGGVNIKDVSD